MQVIDRGPATGSNVIENIRLLTPGLRKSDRKVAEIVLADPERFINATIAETAEAAGVSQPTVIRFCGAIGCEGFQDFKIKLAQSLALGTPATHSAIAEDDTSQQVATKIFNYTMTSLDWARHKLDISAIDRAVDVILDATHLEFFGFGASAIVAQDAQQKFPLFGIPCNATMDSHQQLMAASMMAPGSVAVAISNTGTTRSIIELSRLAREQGAKVIAITGSPSTALINYSDVVINVETLDNTDVFTPTTSRIAALAVVDIVSTLVARRLGQQHNDRLVRMKRHLAQMRRNENF
ncbi:SIS domain-containing protein [Pelagibacterium montanilacus]|uniref:SIS domain-containing protein n=1 Tax=Pelagibacterium montanilacus TaxID=2185280 RepID=UPI000F8D236A|nr:SIS domain-containing protein [Pelagibacterium montanilacus]